MVIYDQVIEEFFKELEEDRDFPDAVRENLKDLWRNDEMASRARLYEAIKMGCDSAYKD